MVETIIIVILLVVALFYTDTVSTKKFFNEDDGYLLFLKEKDYDFLLTAKYGENVNINKVFMGRIKTAFYSFLMFFCIMLISGNLSFLNTIILVVVCYLIFKSGYTNLKSFRKKYMAQIDLLLPYYLKSLEILAQHYTIPVALRKSIDSAPSVFKKGLEHMCDQIEAGDSSVEPYMEFAREYPVRDSMRMMRLLYRLSIGSQENKQEQLLMFSRTISSLQAKARDQKYKERLEAIEKRTLVMLICTGGGVMLIMMLAMMSMMTAL
jgi:hypothetical protein